MSKYRVCDDVPRHCKTFNTLKDLVEWANEELLKNTEIKVGDIVTIEDYGKMYTTLGVDYFQDLWLCSEIDDDEIYKIMIHYDYGCSYGVGHNPSKVSDRIKWKVVYIYNDKVFIERHDVNAFVDDAIQVLCIDKSGLTKYEEV